MTNKEMILSETVENITAFLGKQEDQFIALNKHCPNQLDFLKESQFALQLLTKNDFLLNVARGNPDSLQSAISNVAAIGISLNPALAFAYLVPRKVNKSQSVCLDISYRGLIKLATDTGVVKAMKAELVYANDTFTYNGFHEKPEFHADPFADRGELRGVYAMALLADGTVLVETMSIDEVNAIRDDSEAYKSALDKGGWTLDNNVWVKFYTEMVKKTVIKRAYKTLPTSKGMEVVGKAIEVINEHEGIEFKPPELTYTDDEMAEFKRCAEDVDFYNLSSLVRTLDPQAQIDLMKACLPEPEKGLKIKTREAWEKRLKEAYQEVDANLVFLKERIDEGDDDGATEILESGSRWTVDYFLSNLSPEQEMAANKLMEAA